MWKNIALRVGGILFWVLFWLLLCMIIQKNILLPTPLETCRHLALLLQKQATYSALLETMRHIGIGFSLAFLFGIFSGIVCGKSEVLYHLVSPAVRFSKSVPVAAFVVLVLLWLGASRLSIAISILIAFPMVFEQTFAYMKHQDQQMLEMARVYHMPYWKRIFYIDRVAIGPALVAVSKSAYGMCWKAAIAAEVIGIAKNTVGEQLYMAKIYIETADLFAWIIVIVVVSGLCEALLVWLLCLIFGVDRSAIGKRGS